MFTQIDFHIRGIAPLLMHNGQTCDPLNPFAKAMKEITSKKTKTDADRERLAELEWQAALYVDGEGFAVIPSVALESCIFAGATAQKLGKQFKSAIFVDEDAKLQFPGRKPAMELISDPRFRDVRSVVVNRSRVMRTRPVFHEWECKFTLGYNEELVNKGQVVAALENAGMTKGILDFRPRFGRFEIVD